MLTANECLNFDDYAFKSSPESCSSNSCSTDYNDLPSDEDFLQQLSSDLDIPLLLNPGEDEMRLLNSFFDKSPEEIMSEIALPALPNDNFEDASMNGIKIEPDSCSSSNKSNSPVQSPDPVKFFEIKDEMKIEPPEIETRAPKLQPKATKRVPIQPKTAKNKMVLFKNSDYSNLNPTPPKVVVLENVATITPAVNNCSIPPVILNSNSLPINVGNIDPKILKRQQRKIKNRESACLSRKKKKDYLTSLENQVKELTAENQKLKMQNMQLTERLMKYEGNNGQKTSGTSNMKTNIVLCMFLFSVALNFDYLRNPFISRNQANILETNTPKMVDHHGRNLLWASDDLLENNTNSNFLPFSMCPAAINQTESARLVLELERWIGKPKNMKDDPPAINATKLNISDLKPRSLRKRKPKKYASPLVSNVYSLSQKLEPVETNKEIQVFSPSSEQIYSEFFEAINRQSDTFYVVSFSDHHLLLPALHHNKTRRPKMSLIMPSMLSNGNISQPLVPLMQIDCEVLDTRLIQVRYGSIPVHLRKNGNDTVQNNDDVGKNNDAPANYTHKKAYKPYFIKKKSVSTKDEDFYNIR